MILVAEDGRIVERGTHDALIAELHRTRFDQQSPPLEPVA